MLLSSIAIISVTLLISPFLPSMLLLFASPSLVWSVCDSQFILTAHMDAFLLSKSYVDLTLTYYQFNEGLKLNKLLLKPTLSLKTELMAFLLG